MMSTILAVVLAMPTPCAGVRVRIALVFDGTASAPLEASIVKEAANIWAPYGVDVLDGTGMTWPAPGLVTLHVGIVDKASPDTSDHALGSIPFRADLPDPVISLYAGTASDLVSDAASSSISHWPATFHNAVLARVLGRALAHEIGHYLLRTREHVALGLMRADLPIVELMEVYDNKLKLSSQQQAAIRRDMS